jgi:cobalt-zinc-cadmium efflux system membrane fusion protein
VAEVEQQFMASERLQFASTAIGLQVSIEQAQQEVDLKRAELGRAQQLYEGGAIAQKQLQTADFDLKQAQAKLDGVRRAKQQYDAAASASDSGPRRAPVLAPISGTIIATDAAIGQQVDPSRSLLTIADLSTVWIEAAVHERDLPRIYGAKTAAITIPASSGAGFTGRPVTIGNLVDAQNRTVPVIYSVDNRGGALKIEMFVEAHIPTTASVRVLAIPAAAVVSEGGASVVYVEIEPGAYQRRVVTLGQRKGDTIVVMSGLRVGDRVVTVGAQLLRSESRKGEIPVEEEEKGEHKD